MFSYLILVFILIIIIILLVLKFTRFPFILCDSNVCLVGKTALVTGGSSGIGYQIVLSLASRGCRVIVAGRTVSNDLKNKIVEETSNENIVLEYLDLASFTSIRRFVDRLKNSEKKLDILINNAGIGKSDAFTEDGLGMTMQTNHYGPFLLTHLLIDLLKKSDEGRIIFTTSILAFFHVISPSFVTSTSIKNLPVWLRSLDYYNSKFCNLVTSDILAEKVRKFNITCNAYHPGITNTQIFDRSREQINFYNPFEILMYVLISLTEIIFGVSSKLTTQAAIQAAVSKEYKNVTGKFVGKLFSELRPRGAHNKKMCNEIWSASEVAVKLKPEEKI